MAEIPVEFVAPEESIEKGFGRLVGPGVAIPGERLQLRGAVFAQTWPFMLPLVIVCMLGGIAIGIGLDDLEIGVWVVSIGGSACVVAYEVFQRYTGREITLEVPATCGFQIERMGDHAVVQIQLDTYVVNGGNRPPLVTFRVTGSQAIDAIRASLTP